MLNLLVFDMETTGLFPKEHDILEVAYAGVQVNDQGDLEIDEIQHHIVKIPIFIVKAHLDKTVLKMHTDNGLIKDLEKCKGDSLKSIEQKIIDYIKSSFGDSRPQLCGNSIAFDRDFIKHKMPTLDSVLHYRMIDLSSLRTLAKYFGNYRFAEGSSNHRAKDDCKYIIEQLHLVKGLLSKVQGD